MEGLMKNLSAAATEQKDDYEATPKKELGVCTERKG
jgi:hypothetical protein